MHPLLSRALARNHGVLRRRDHPELVNAIDVALRREELIASFRGVYTAPDPDHATRLRALSLADPDAVVTGASAEYFHGWRTQPPADVEAASGLASRPGFALTRRLIPRRLTTRSDGVRYTSRALTAVDLATTRGVEEVDEALRRRIPLEKLWDAYLGTPNRRRRRRLYRWLTESRSQPWSPLERAAHLALHHGRVRGWVANHTVALDAEGARAHPDIAFRTLKLAIEVDGWRWHAGEAAFERDRLRDVRLGELGWQVVRFPGAWVLKHPERFAACVARIVAARQIIVA